MQQGKKKAKLSKTLFSMSMNESWATNLAIKPNVPEAYVAKSSTGCPQNNGLKA